MRERQPKKPLPYQQRYSSYIIVEAVQGIAQAISERKGQPPLNTEVPEEGLPISRPTFSPDPTLE